MNLEVLLVEDNDKNWNVIGIATMNTYIDKNFLKASKNAIEICKSVLNAGNSISINKDFKGIEVTPNDLIISDNDELTKTKNIALKDIVNLMNLNIFSVNVIDAMDYLNCYMKLLAAGIFITDQNREDKYFEIIEAAQENEEPAILSENATFEQEQEYINAKKKYDLAQDNLATLEKYLNAYDKLAKINFVNTLLQDIKTNILDAKTSNDVLDIMKNSEDTINKYFYTRDNTFNITNDNVMPPNTVVE